MKFKNLIINDSLVYFVGHLVCVVTARDLRESYHPGDMIEVTRYVKYDDVRRDSMINVMLTWHKLSFLIGHFEFEV